MNRMYEALGIDPDIMAFGEEVLASLKERFDQIDKNAEYNQLKVSKPCRMPM